MTFVCSRCLCMFEWKYTERSKDLKCLNCGSRKGLVMLDNSVGEK